jgi:hypothetical protein
MGIDVVDKVTGTKLAYQRMRGASPRAGKQRPTGGSWMSSGMVPNTTWGDVYVASHHFNKYLKLVPQKTSSTSILGFLSPGVSTYMGAQDYAKRAADFNRAKKLFDSVGPLAKGGNFFQAGMLDRMKQIYPYNEEFWGAATTLAIERSAAGEIPRWDDIAIESIREAAQELPANVGAALSAIDPRKMIPDFGPMAEIIKWGSIGGGLFMLYWFVLKPKGKKKSA